MLGQMLGLAALLPAVGLIWVGPDGNQLLPRAPWDPRDRNPLLDREDDDDLEQDDDEEDDEDEQDEEWIEQEEELDEEEEDEEEE